MPDISMCSGFECPLRDTCYRYTAKPDERQTWFGNPPVKDGKCKEYWKDIKRNG